MYLKSIELTGFKSFAKKSLFEFTSPISSIVGPNGSGKSNVAEAFRFVLGEQSMKSMRGKRGEDLIFNGSGETPKGNRASVKLVFDNSHKVFPSIDFEEVSLEREVYRDGTNEYSVNGSKVRLKDIFELLSQAHIGASGHHIISQGEADRILSSNPKERKDMIEDALGLKAYQYKKEESERKLEKTRENMKEVEGLRREIAPHLKFLKKQMEKVARVEEMRNSLSKIAADFFGSEESYIKGEKERLKNESTPLKNELSQIEKGIAEARKKLSEKSKVHELTDDLHKAEGEKEKIRNEANELVREIGRLEGELSALKRLSQVKTGEAIPLAKAAQFLEKLHSLVSELKDLAKNGDTASIASKAIEIEKEINSFKAEHKTNEKGEGDELKEILSKKENLAEDLLNIKKKEEEASKKHTEILRAIDAEKDSSRSAEKDVYELLSKEKDIQAKISEISNAERIISMRDDEMKTNMREVGAIVGTALLSELSKTPSKKLSLEEIENSKKEIERMKIRLEESGAGGVGDIEKEFKEVSERDTFLEKELADLGVSAESLESLISDLSEKLENDFEIGLKKINTAFEEFFGILFGGGKATLQLKTIKKRQQKSEDDEENEEVEEESESGIDIAVSLPRKKISGLMMLSGGERALTSIALIFAMSQVNPPPFIILDETDAALDEANSKRYGDMVENLAAKSQLIVITHNRETMSRAGVIYGVTMGGSGVSKVLSIAFADAEAIAK